MNIERIIQTLGVDFKLSLFPDEIYREIMDLNMDETSYLSMFPAELMEILIESFMFGKEERYEYNQKIGIIGKEMPGDGLHLLTYYIDEHPHIMIVDIEAEMFKILYSFFTSQMRFKEIHIETDCNDNHHTYLCMHAYYTKCMSARVKFDRVVIQRIHPISKYRIDKSNDFKDMGPLFLYDSMWKTIEARMVEDENSSDEEDSDDSSESDDDSDNDDAQIENNNAEDIELPD